MNRFSDRYYDDKIIDVYSRYLTTQHKLSSGLAVLPTIAQRSVLLLSALVFSRAVRGDFSRLAYAGFDQISPLIRSSTALGVDFFDARCVAWHMIILLPNDNGFLLFALRVVVMPISGSLHWSTLVFCHMNALKAFWNGDEAVEGSPVPCLLHLDSLPGSHMAASIAKIARQVALDEWVLFSADRLARTTGAELLLLRVRNDVIMSRLKDLVVVSPSVPLQPNVVDCGVYHVALVEDITTRCFSVTAADLLSSPPCDRHYSSRLFEQSSIEVSRDPPLDTSDLQLTTSMLAVTAAFDAGTFLGHRTCPKRARARC